VEHLVGLVELLLAQLLLIFLLFGINTSSLNLYVEKQEPLVTVDMNFR